MAAHLGLPADAIVVNVQGDEPLIPPVIIDQVAANLAAHPEAGIATLAEPIHDPETVFNPNAVKVVSDINGLALTFSRATAALGPRCLCQGPQRAARRRAVSPSHRHVCLPRRLPAGFCRLGAMLA